MIITIYAILVSPKTIQGGHDMKRHCIIFILISCAFILTACNSSPVPENKNLPETSTDFESIEVGTKREDILRSFG